MGKKYSNEVRLEWLKSIHPNFKNEDWHNENVYKPTDLKCFEFFEKYKEYDTDINPNQIIGIKYFPSYNCDRNITWLELFYDLHRLDRVIDNFKNIEDLKNHINKDIDQKFVYKYGNHYFTTSGQHRLCLAKLLHMNSINVSIVEYKLNKQKLVRSLKLAKYQELFQHINVHTTGNYLENIHFKISDKGIRMEFEIFEKFIKYYQTFKIYPFIKYFQLIYNQIIHTQRQGYDIEINKIEDLRKLNYLIIKNKLSKKIL